MSPPPLDIGALAEQAWDTLRQRLTAAGIALQPAYIEAITPVWRALPQNAFAALAFANALMINDRFVLYRRLMDLAREEACGAALLGWAIDHSGPSLAETLADHRKDELRHSRMYLSACDSVLPERAGDRIRDFEVSAEEEFGQPLDRDSVAPLMASIHVGELRNWINLSIYLSLLSQSNCIYAEHLHSVIKTVENDESHHVFYTSAFVNKWLMEENCGDESFRNIARSYAGCWWNDVARINRWAATERDFKAASPCHVPDHRDPRQD
ncbi:MAG: hypothetical protein F8N37_09630 [Telmatospirillum sp.]|nr:hypothetical protein [Telmatospirillum sp.]